MPTISDLLIFRENKKLLQKMSWLQFFSLEYFWSDCDEYTQVNNTGFDNKTDSEWQEFSLPMNVCQQLANRKNDKKISFNEKNRDFYKKIKILMGHIDPNTLDTFYNPLLWYATRRLCPYSTLLLLSHGADPNIASGGRVIKHIVYLIQTITNYYGTKPSDEVNRAKLIFGQLLVFGLTTDNIHSVFQGNNEVRFFLNRLNNKRMSNYLLGRITDFPLLGYLLLPASWLNSYCFDITLKTLENKLNKEIHQIEECVQAKTFTLAYKKAIHESTSLFPPLCELIEQYASVELLERTLVYNKMLRDQSIHKLGI